MFPFDLDENEEIISLEEKPEPKEYEIDFKTGQLTGKVVTGLEAIRVWVWLTTHTERYRYQQYSWDYGIEFDSLIGQGYSQEYIETEVERMLKECLLTNSFIQDVELLECMVIDDKLHVLFDVTTDYGEVEMDV